jgi:hypothetical protein
MFRVDLWHIYALFLLPLVMNQILLNVVFPESAKTLGWFVPILVIEGLLGWFIQRRRTISFARDWLVYRRLTEQENWVVEGVIEYVLSYSDQTGGRMVSISVSQDGENGEIRSSYFFLPIDVDPFNEASKISGGGPIRIIVRAFQRDDILSDDAAGEIVGFLPSPGGDPNSHDRSEKLYVRGLAGGG